MARHQSDAPLIPMIGYWRVSYGREEMLSPALQQEEISRWAKRNGRRVVRWVGDPDDTGRDFDRRVQEAIAAVEAGEAAEIGVYRYTRWGRNTLESLQNIKRVEDAGGDVISVTEYTGGMGSSFSRSIRRDLLSRAEHESDQIGDGWRQAHAARVRDGLPSAGTARFGYVRLGRVPDEDRKNAYRRDPDDPAGERYVPDVETGPLLAALYERYAGGEPVRSLIRWLNETGVPTASAGRWTRDSLRQVLASGFGAGLLRVHDPACTKRHGRKDPKCPRAVYVPGAHEPVISEGTWQAFLDRQEARRQVPMRLRDPAYPLSGLLYCGSSGHRLTVTRGDGGAVAYRCPRRAEGRDCEGAYVRAVLAEETVLAWLGQWAAGIEAAAAVSAARDRTAARAHAGKDRLAEEEARLQRRLARLMTRWVNDEQAEEAAYELARKPLLASLEDVRARMAAATRAQAANTGTWRPVVVGLIAEWRTFSPARRREMLGHLIARIEVHRTGRGKPARIVIVPVWEDA
jgi:DNA invertase Pin-like site-specific DNA recombinase